MSTFVPADIPPDIPKKSFVLKEAITDGMKTKEEMIDARETETRCVDDMSVRFNTVLREAYLKPLNGKISAKLNGQAVFDHPELSDAVGWEGVFTSGQMEELRMSDDPIVSSAASDALMRAYDLMVTFSGLRDAHGKKTRVQKGLLGSRRKGNHCCG